MKATGVVRRIDDLGRIVIPKEIRKTLRIKDGESLEIFLESDNIVLKKYSQLENLSDFYKNYVDSIYSELNKNILIVDRTKIVAAAGNLRKKYVDKNISAILDEQIKSRKPIYEPEKKDISLINGDIINISYALSPIIVDGDIIGAVIIASSDSNIDEFEYKTVLIASKFLSKYIEQ